MNKVCEKILELLTKASTLLPDDVAAALESAERQEAEGGIGKSAMRTIIENVRLAKERVLPMCQDTGMIHFFVTAPPSFSRKAFRASAEEAVVEATRRGLLRQN
ncbi:MAG: fumarate hydratase, partial [Lentisphaeria bacterium]|nr:fumarate hydratase [Lentisphaeria bacterium]